jgi:hypothetical protein
LVWACRTDGSPTKRKLTTPHAYRYAATFHNLFFHRYPVVDKDGKPTSSSLSSSVTQFSLEHGVQVTLEVKTDLFAFSKVTDGCTRTQEYLIDSTTVSMAQCMSVFAAAGVRPSFINSLAAMAPSTKTGNSQAHADVLLGKCTSFTTSVAPTTVPPNWLTTPYVLTRTSKLTASFGFVGPTLRVAPADINAVFLENKQQPLHPFTAPFANMPARNILLETDIYPIMRSSMAGMEMFVIPFVSTHVQLKHQVKNEPGPCQFSGSRDQLYARHSLF